MALPNVNITVNRSGLGLVSFTNDGIMGIVLDGEAVIGKLELNKPYVVYSLSDAENIGITEDDNAIAYKQVNEFYKEAGNGAKLWLIVTDNTLMSASVIGTANAVRTMVETAKGEISLVGLTAGNTQSNVVVDGLNEDVFVALSEAQILANEYQSKIMPFSVLVAGIGFSGDENTVKDFATTNYHRCSVLLAASEDDKVASVGQYLGRLAAIPVQRKASRVKDGALFNLDGYLTDGLPVSNRTGALNVLHDKHYIVYRTFPGKSGFYYSGDPTATANTDDLCTIARNRIIDKVLKITYNTYVEELDDDVPMTDDGKLAPAVVGYLKSKIELQVNSQTVDEISNFTALIDDNQNILSGMPLEIELQITPKGYLSPINVKIGFINPFLKQ